MKITTFTAVAFSIALSGLAHADGPRPGYGVPAPVPQSYDEGYYGGGQGAAVEDEYLTEERVERRREVVVQPALPIAPPAVLPIPGPGYGPGYGPGHGVRALPPPFPPLPGSYCKVLPSRISPELTTLVMFWPGQQPWAQDLSRGPILFNTMNEYQARGYCLNLHRR